MEQNKLECFPMKVYKIIVGEIGYREVMQLDSDKHSSLLYSILTDEEKKLSNVDTKLNFGNGPPH